MSSLTVRTVVHPPIKVLELEQSTPKGPVFRWSDGREGWLECTEKAELMVVDSRPGHQYLTTEGIDDALVELCYLEYRPPYVNSVRKVQDTQ
jgi:hypothetical protein